LTKILPKTVRVIRPCVIDLEFCDEYELEEGQTYYDDGTTIFDAYIKGGIEDGSLIEATRDRNTVIVSSKRLLRTR
jgi:hypothetical protein